MTEYDPIPENTFVEDTSADGELRRRVESVYQACWDEFYAWEPKYCREELRNLGDGSVNLSCDAVWADIEEWEDEMSLTATTTSIDPVQILLGRHLNLSEVQVKTLKLRVNFPAVPPYEFCMPITRCINCIDQDEEELEEEVSDSETTDIQSWRPKRWRVLWIKFCPYTDPDEPMLALDRNRLLEGTKLEWEKQPYIDNDSKHCRRSILRTLVV